MLDPVLKVYAEAGAPLAEAEFDGRRFHVLIGRTGAIAAADKREGDGKTPLGTWNVLYGLYRADRVALPRGTLKWEPVTRDMGWCDAAGDALYNQPVKAGYPVSHEALWRDDAAYDYILVTDHNTPAVPGMGSAVFVHIWRDGATETAGCVALKPADMAAVAPHIRTVDVMLI